MAEALLEVVLENLNSLVQKELATFWHVDKEIEKLSNTLTTIKAVLEDAEQKQITNQSLKVWLQKLKDAACVLDDILDECSIKSSQLGHEGRSLAFLNPKNILFRHKVGKKMKEIRERLDQMAEERKNFHLCEGTVERGTEAVEDRQTCSTIAEQQVYGRDEDRDRIVEFLIGHAGNCDDVSVYSIVGIGGVGKTTLAQLAYNDERVSRQFDLLIWVCVSENFSVKKILQSIIESATKRSCDTLDLDPLQKKIQELLQSKRYLLVLDDVWNEDQDKWDKLKYVLACGSKGASILVTTRLRNVASIMGTIPTHYLSGISELDCWSLLKQRAFGPHREERAELVAIGKEIVKKCGGLPLAAKALGGLLRFKSKEKEWLDVKESEIWNLPMDKNSVLPALRLSYSNLPPELRQCFAFCAIFPKDWIIEMELLIHLWMANGFISSERKMTMEDIGSEIWNELYQRCFFQDITTNEFGQVKCFKMHDFIHDLACSILGEECLVWEDASLSNLTRTTRHIACYRYSNQPFDLGVLRNVDSLRTLMLRYRKGHFDSSTLHSIRALTATAISSIPLGNFIHLRYLDLSSSGIKFLPKSIYCLQRLQTLKLEWCDELRKLPKHLRRLKDLRHLLIRGCDSLSGMPLKVGELTCLKSLSIFIVDSKEGYRLAEIQSLELEAELHIRGLENTASPLDARNANLIGKKDLHCLQLSWGWKDKKQSLGCDAEQVLEALQPHSNIMSLGINHYAGDKFPNWMTNIAILSNLVSLELMKCNTCLQLPPLGKLPSLRILRIYGMEYVQYIDNESYDGGAAPRAFTSLEKLVLVELPNLESFLKEERMEMFPCLSELSIHDCPRLRLPCLPSVKRLTITGCTEELLQPISIRHNLTSLTLRDCVDLTSFPEGMMRNLSCLKTLTIDGFFKLKVLPIERINSIALEELEIQSCPELESFPEQFLEGLCSLRILLIYSCEKFRSLSEGFQHLTLLENLEICGCPNLVSLTDGLKHLNRLHKLTIIGGCCPQGIEHIPCLRSLQLDSLREVTSLPDSLGELTTLQRLSIGDCPKLTTLPTSLGELTTLQRLSIYRCPKLTTLPTSLGDLINLQRLSINWCPSLRTLPTSFQHLTNLHSVTIDDCPKLVKRCKDETWDVVRTWNQSMTPEYSKRGVWGQSAVGWNREGKRK